MENTLFFFFLLLLPDLRVNTEAPKPAESQAASPRAQVLVDAGGRLAFSLPALPTLG